MRSGQLIDGLGRLDGGPRRKHRHATIGEDAEPLDVALAAWLSESAVADLAYAYEAVAWARALPALATILPELQWWRLWDHLVGLTDECDWGRA